MTFVLVLLSWVLFRADDLTAALNYFLAMFGLAAVNPASILLGAELYSPLHVLSIGLAAALVFQPVQAHEWAQKPLSWAHVALLLPLFALSLMVMFSQAFNPFLYFQF
jgi:alginate O-acetyltransferase complex protein AlgI